ncbi:hypothetical protein M404DRAFT_1008776 [Pisolithus tinctorius Marx 270]|uniref:Uncharacterized protein n=1 Tax=Pisolithus tinctorius Marx 270 TaxID=870435 RepID=A0A0C3I9C2_PISTI|nr:hypothetical protein M404DRAFT_1008776 [Pisolithus tinctorius Marx 270]
MTGEDGGKDDCLCCGDGTEAIRQALQDARFLLPVSPDPLAGFSSTNALLVLFFGKVWRYNGCHVSTWTSHCDL